MTALAVSDSPYASQETGAFPPIDESHKDERLQICNFVFEKEMTWRLVEKTVIAVALA